MLVDSGAACHVCPPAWAHRMSPENKQAQRWVKTTESGEVAPIRKDVRDPGPQPVRQDAPLVERDRQGNMLDAVLSVIQCDYVYRTDVGDESAVALFATCRSSTTIFATLCTMKGSNDALVVAAFASWIWELELVWSSIVTENPPFSLLSQLSETRSLLMEQRTEGFTRVQWSCKAHRATGARDGACLHGRCVTQRGRTTDFMCGPTLGQHSG